MKGGNTGSSAGGLGAGSGFAAGLGYFARAQTAGADVHSNRGSPDESTDALNVRIPATLGATVGVRDVHAERRLLAADFADGCHVNNLLDLPTLPVANISEYRRTIVASLAMPTINSLTANDLERAVRVFAALLGEHREVINRLNVYPVPDGDTGTNMSLTMTSVVQELDALPDPAPLKDVAAAIARASLMGARGNSGVILSQMLRGFVQGLVNEEALDVEQLVAGLVRADEMARAAVSNPVEGTILSVARAGALGAQSEHEHLATAVVAARDAARLALALTPEQLPVLKQAGVVDSGGTGLLLWFDALCHVVLDAPLPPTPALPDVHFASTPESESTSTLAQLRYEVMFLLEGDDDRVAAFRAAWESLGDSIVIVGGDGLYNCHIHTDLIGASIEAALDVGRPSKIRVTDLLEQVGEESMHRAFADRGPSPRTSVVAVVAGEGAAALYRSLGVREVVIGGQTMNPSTAELVAAVKASGSSEVVILPNNKNIRPVAQQIDALVDATVRVVPTNSVLEGLAAMVAYQADADAQGNEKTMSDFASRIVTGEVTRAVRDTTTDAGEVHVGDWIGVARSGICAIASSLETALIDLATFLGEEQHEILTVLEGEGSSKSTTDALLSFVAERFPAIDVEVHAGGQPLYPYLLGFE